MSEGEFKERIIKALSYALEDPITKELLNLVDEANKEFPKKHKVQTGWKDQYTPEYSEKYDDEEIQTWLKKWFGEQKVEVK